MHIESDTEASDFELGLPLDPDQMRLTPVFTAELWSTETNEDPDTQRGNKQIETEVCRDVPGKWVHVSKVNSMNDWLWRVPPTHRRLVLRSVHMNPMSAHPSEEDGPTLEREGMVEKNGSGRGRFCEALPPVSTSPHGRRRSAAPAETA